MDKKLKDLLDISEFNQDIQTIKLLLDELCDTILNFKLGEFDLDDFKYRQEYIMHKLEELKK